MSGIPEATVIILTAEKRAELESLARSTKTEHRLRQRARIVLLAADGVASRSIGRAVGCTTGTASKWRVRYARKRRAGLDETGERGAEPKYTTETNKRILALLDQPPPEGYARWTGPLLAAALGDVDVQYVWRLLRAQKIDLAGRQTHAYRHRRGARGLRPDCRIRRQERGRRSVGPHGREGTGGCTRKAETQGNCPYSCAKPVDKIRRPLTAIR
jgi:transposase